MSQPSRADACQCGSTGDFTLQSLGSTTIQIALQWAPVPAAIDYALDRDTSCDFTGATSTALPNTTYAYGDTGVAPDNRCRFHTSGTCPFFPHTLPLTPGVTYYYRVRAQTSGGEKVSNCVAAQLATAPVRGVAGDQWADIVLGQADFGQNVPLAINERGTISPGGVLVDRRPTGSPAHVFVVDATHNRILGFDHLGHCNGQPCTSDSDCAASTCVLDYPNLVPDFVLGQDSLIDAGACNGDGTAQLYPSRAPASASSLCLIPPTQISIKETVFSSLLDIDSNGTLYVPDLYNNRILAYDDPFTTDQVADAVWGQADFTGNECNRGLATPSCSSLCFFDARHAGVALDDTESLWVADPANARVLRFPRCPRAGSACNGVPAGAIAPVADVVLGQPNCTSNTRGDIGRPTTMFFDPLDVEFDKSSRTLYVADAGDNRVESRILEFHPDPQAGDFVTGMAGVELPVSLPANYPGTPPDLCFLRPIELDLDTLTNGLWVRQDTDRCVDLVDVSTGEPSHTVYGSVMRGFSTDRDGNLLVTNAYDGLLRYKRQPVGMGPAEKVFGGAPDGPGGVYTARSFHDVRGVTVLSDPLGQGGDQLIVADAFRMMIWNNFDIDTLTNGTPADDLYGAPDFDDGSLLYQKFFHYPQVHGGQLWVETGRGGSLMAFDYPLCGSHWQTSGIGCTGASTPVRNLQVHDVAFPVRGQPGQSITPMPGDDGAMDFAVTSSGDAVWIADRQNNRVLRLTHLNGPEPIDVDVVLGQTRAAGTRCDRGQANPGADTLCIPYAVALDANDNLYVADNGGETGTVHRLLEFDAATLASGATARFAVPATRVFGTGGRFDTTGFSAPSDPYISPFKPILSPSGAMVVASNPYATQRHPLAYLDPLGDQLPQFALGDMQSYPETSGFIDRRGDLFLADFDWSRVLIYKQAIPPPLCGNGTIDPGEECDDGNSNSGDGCTNACTLCGNGIVSPGEQCDDGNLVDGDGCRSDCTYELIPGDGAGSHRRDKHACLLEWAVLGPDAVAPTDRHGRPNFVRTCKDNDPACDFDPAVGVCGFEVVACLNNVDANLPMCARLGVADPVVVKRPRSRTDPANYAAITAALADLRDPVTGSTGLVPPIDPSRFGLCTSPFRISVPLRRPNRKAKLTLRTLVHEAASVRRPKRDVDRLKLICTP